jgi:3-hydroxyisobutyrate dehydrogenase
MTATAQSAARGLVTETIAVLGAGGTMGLPIARNIARAGLPVRAWGRAAGEAKPLAEDGVYLAASPRDAAAGAGIVITMLADEEAVVGAMDGPDGVLAVMREEYRRQAGAAQGSTAAAGAADPAGPHHPLWVQMSAIGMQGARRCAELANGQGVGFVDAPVLGTRQPAEEGKLIVLESGPEEARPRLQPIFDAIGQRTFRVGEAGEGSRLKLVTDNWVHALVEATEEGHGLNLPLVEAIARRFAEEAPERADPPFSF